MKIRLIDPKSLSKENFKNYGEVISTDGEYIITNQGTGKKWNNLVRFDMYEDGGEVNLGILRTRKMEFRFTQMERHLYTSQIFIPLGGKRSLVAVAPASDKGPNPDEVEVFIVEGNQGVSFFRKTWHHTLFPIDEDTEYVVMMRGTSGPLDVELKSFDNIEIKINTTSL